MDLQGLFSRLAPKRDPNLLVGIETMDDASVYRLNDETAVILTADFITPVIDDARLFGQIAAANSISDVYAMGGRPVNVLNLCMFPVKGVDGETLSKILQGGLDKTEEAGALLVGGHTVRDSELKYGLSVFGLVHPKKYTPNTGARAGDKMILTKPIGTGVHISGGKQGLIPPEKLTAVARVMATLNKTACETMVEFECRGATDITGFGLSGHGYGMAKGSGVTIRFFLDQIPKFPDTLDLIGQGVGTGVTATNAKMVEGKIRFSPGISTTEQGLFFDPQTSGGLFIAVRSKDAEAMVKKLHERGVKDARIVGECVTTDAPILDVVR